MTTPDELLMAELKQVMTEATASIHDERTAEAKQIVRLLDEQFTKDGYYGSYLFTMTKATDEEFQAMVEGSTETVGDKPDDIGSGQYHGGKVSKVYTFDTHADLVQIVTSPQAMLMTYHLRKQVALIIRTNLPDGRRITACAATGFVVVKADDKVSMLCLDDADPQPKLAFADFDAETIELFHSLWQGHVYPSRMEQDFPETYKEVITKLTAEAEGEDE